MKKHFYLLLALILALPLVSAEDCGLLNLASCIPQQAYNFIIGIINAPLQPLLDLTRSLLTEPINLSLFLPLWSIILYILSKEFVVKYLLYNMF